MHSGSYTKHIAYNTLHIFTHITIMQINHKSHSASIFVVFFFLCLTIFLTANTEQTAISVVRNRNSTMSIDMSVSVIIPSSSGKKHSN